MIHTVCGQVGCAASAHLELHQGPPLPAHMIWTAALQDEATSMPIVSLSYTLAPSALASSWPCQRPKAVVVEIGRIDLRYRPQCPHAARPTHGQRCGKSSSDSVQNPFGLMMCIHTLAFQGHYIKEWLTWLCRQKSTVSSKTTWLFDKTHYVEHLEQWWLESQAAIVYITSSLTYN